MTTTGDKFLTRKTTNAFSKIKLKADSSMINSKMTSLFNIQKLNFIIFFQLTTLLIFLIMIVFSLLRFYYSIKYIDNLSLSINILKLLSTKYSLPFQIFSMMRLFMFKNSPIMFKSFSLTSWRGKIAESDNGIRDNLTDFQHTSDIILLYNKKISELSESNILTICGNNTACLTEIKNENGLCYGGITLCIDNVILQLAQMSSDLGAKKSFPIEDLYKYFDKNEIHKIEEVIEFVLGRAKSGVYNAFLEDIDVLKKVSSKKLNIVNLTNFVFVIIVSIVCFILFRKVLSTMHKQIVSATFKMKCFMLYKG